MHALGQVHWIRQQQNVLPYKLIICFQYMLITFEGIEYCRFLDKNEPEKGALEEMRFPTLERMLAVSGGV